MAQALTKAEEIVLKALDVNRSEVTLYILPDGSIQVNKKPKNYVAYFVMRKVNKTWEPPEHPLENKAVDALEDIANIKADHVIYDFDCELYTSEKYVGKASVATIVYYVIGPATGRGDYSRAWAIAFNWRDRLIKKYPELAPFAKPRVEGNFKPSPALDIRLPIVTDEFIKLVSTILNDDLESEIRRLEEEIAKKERELEELKRRLEALKKLANK